MAFVLVSAAVLLLFNAYLSRVSFLASSARLAQAERAALSEADFLLSECPAGGGLLKCAGGYRYANELSADAGLSLGGTGNVSVRLLDLQGNVIAWSGKASAGEGAPGDLLCVRRLALLGDEAVVLEVCAS